MWVKDVIILANSSKRLNNRSGHCIAGKSFVQPGKWVRLVNRLDDSGDTIPFSDRELGSLCGNYQGPALFDRYSIRFDNTCGLYCQPENELITRFQWKFKEKFPLIRASELYDPVPEWLELCGNEGSDRIPYSLCNPDRPLSGSLFFTRLTQEENNVEIVHDDSFNRSRYRLMFDLNERHYYLVIKDIAVHRALKTGQLQVGELSSAYVTIGLGQLFDNSHYKLVVGMVPEVSDAEGN